MPLKSPTLHVFFMCQNAVCRQFTGYEAQPLCRTKKHLYLMFTGTNTHDNARKHPRTVINMKQRVYTAWRRKLTAYSAVLRPLADLINRAPLITALSPKIMPWGAL